MSSSLNIKCQDSSIMDLPQPTLNPTLENTISKTTSSTMDLCSSPPVLPTTKLYDHILIHGTADMVEVLAMYQRAMNELNRPMKTSFLYDIYDPTTGLQHWTFDDVMSYAKYERDEERIHELSKGNHLSDHDKAMIEEFDKWNVGDSDYELLIEEAQRTPSPTMFEGAPQSPCLVQVPFSSDGQPSNEEEDLLPCIVPESNLGLQGSPDSVLGWMDDLENNQQPCKVYEDVDLRATPRQYDEYVSDSLPASSRGQSPGSPFQCAQVPLSDETLEAFTLETPVKSFHRCVTSPCPSRKTCDYHGGDLCSEFRPQTPLKSPVILEQMNSRVWESPANDSEQENQDGLPVISSLRFLKVATAGLMKNSLHLSKQLVGSVASEESVMVMAGIIFTLSSTSRESSSLRTHIVSASDLPRLIAAERALRRLIATYNQFREHHSTVGITSEKTTTLCMPRSRDHMLRVLKSHETTCTREALLWETKKAFIMIYESILCEITSFSALKSRDSLIRNGVQKRSRRNSPESKKTVSTFTGRGTRKPGNGYWKHSPIRSRESSPCPGGSLIPKKLNFGTFNSWQTIPDSPTDDDQNPSLSSERHV